VLASDANLVELGLLRGGARLLANRELLQLVESLDPTPAYLVAYRTSPWHIVCQGLLFRGT